MQDITKDHKFISAINPLIARAFPIKTYSKVELLAFAFDTHEIIFIKCGTKSVKIEGNITIAAEIISCILSAQNAKKDQYSDIAYFIVLCTQYEIFGPEDVTKLAGLLGNKITIFGTGLLITDKVVYNPPPAVIQPTYTPTKVSKFKILKERDLPTIEEQKRSFSGWHIKTYNGKDNSKYIGHDSKPGFGIPLMFSPEIMDSKCALGDQYHKDEKQTKGCKLICCNLVHHTQSDYNELKQFIDDIDNDAVAATQYRLHLLKLNTKNRFRNEIWDTYSILEYAVNMTHAHVEISKFFK